MADGAMYLGHFGLKEAPFTITPDPRYLYMSERHREALAHLVYGLGDGGGFVQLTGEVGTGKTTLCRCLLEQVPAHVDVALILNPRLTSLELLEAVCDELKVPYPEGADSLKVLVDALYRYLLEAHANHRRTVLIVDEAQNLSAEVLEQIRLLTNLETAKEKLLQIILIGQPELVAMLDRQDLRQLAQRITARYHLEPFSDADTRGYIRHRLEVAGRTRGIFSDAAMRRVHREASGIPRLVNVICDRALLGAYASQTRHVDVTTVKKAAAEVRGPRPRWWRALAWRRTAASAVVPLALVGAVVALPRSPSRGRVETSAVVGRGSPAIHPPATLAATAVAVPAAAAALGSARPTLRELLTDRAVRADDVAAFTALYRAWGVADPAGTAARRCAGARDVGLVCTAKSGGWPTLARSNVPAIVELVVPGGNPRYATVTALDRDRVTLDVGVRHAMFSTADVTSFWNGRFTIVWRPPFATAAGIGLGARGPDVAWVAERIALVDGRPGDGSVAVYDERLRDRVVGFQRSRSIHPDGIVGEETLADLAMAVPQPGVPQLAAR